METFIAVIVLSLGSQHQVRAFGGFPSYTACVKFTTWQNKAIEKQAPLSSLTVCYPRSEFLKNFPSKPIESPST